MSDVIKINTEDSLKFNTTPIQNIDVFALVKENNPILKKKTEYFDFQNPPTNANELASMLVETCKHHNGFGLAAPQCGLEYRVFVMGANDEYVAFFNPKIISTSTKTSLLAEGCLSFPMLALKIERPNTIEVEYQDFNGVTRTGTFSGLSSHVFQHELDHLNGVCYTDRAKPVALKIGIKKRKKFNNLVDRYNKAQNKVKSITT